MKIKSDFVTNSSSSSFIVSFPNIIKTVDDVHTFMSMKKAEQVFKDSISQDPIQIKIENDGEKKISLRADIKNILKSKLKNEKTINTLAETICKRIEVEFPEVLDSKTEIEFISNIIKRRYVGDEWWDEPNDLNENELYEFIKENNNTFVYIFSYSDEEGQFGSEMEHGGTFDELPHIRLSHH
jgi:hypothetical protein